MGKSKKMIKSIILHMWNWLEIRCMRMRGYSPTTFNSYTNRYEYELKSEIDDKLESWEDKHPSFEIFGYKKEYVERSWWACDEKSRSKKLKSLRRGECIDKPIFTKRV